jgi:RimJ/RimL family protein N-acetyltransferase
MISEAGPADREAVEAFLLRHVDRAMFPLSNLRSHGLSDGDFGSDHRNAMRVWASGNGPSGILALSRGGMLMPVLPDGGDASRFAQVLAGLDITGAVGPADQVRALLAGLGLAGAPTWKDADEPGFVLNLANLRVPPAADATLVPSGADHRRLLVSWRADYHRETLGTPETEVAERAASEVDAYIQRDSHRVLLLAGQPVAMTGFNAVLPEIVQIGGVYTPPALRNRGHARLAVAMHLAEVRAEGVQRAVLFAASEAAARAYRGIGFQPAAAIALVLFDGAQRVQS